MTQSGEDSSSDKGGAGGIFEMPSSQHSQQLRVCTGTLGELSVVLSSVFKLTLAEINICIFFYLNHVSSLCMGEKRYDYHPKTSAVGYQALLWVNTTLRWFICRIIMHLLKLFIIALQE